MDVLDDIRATDQPGLQWSAMVRDAVSGEVLAEHEAYAVLRTASIGKIFLLLEVARRLEQGDLDPHELLEWQDAEWVADSGLWYRMDSRRLTVLDLATLVGAVSDNLATNVLVRRVGVPAVQALARELGCRDSTLLDRVRMDRGPGDPPTLSRGNAAELSEVIRRIHLGTAVDEATSQRVSDWLAANTDQSMVAAGCDLDPLAHGEADRGLTLINKTGAISAARADVGVLGGPDRTLSYAVLAEWSADSDPRDQVLAAMRGVGRRLRTAVGG